MLAKEFPGYSFDFHSASKVTLNDVGESGCLETKSFGVLTSRSRMCIILVI